MRRTAATAQDDPTPHARRRVSEAPAELSWETLLLLVALTGSLGGIQVVTVPAHKVQKPSPGALAG